MTLVSLPQHMRDAFQGPMSERDALRLSAHLAELAHQAHDRTLVAARRQREKAELLAEAHRVIADIDRRERAKKAALAEALDRAATTPVTLPESPVAGLTATQCAVLYLVGLHRDRSGACRLNTAQIARRLPPAQSFAASASITKLIAGGHLRRDGALFLTQDGAAVWRELAGGQS